MGTAAVNTLMGCKGMSRHKNPGRATTHLRSPWLEDGSAGCQFRFVICSDRKQEKSGVHPVWKISEPVCGSSISSVVSTSAPGSESKVLVAQTTTGQLPGLCPQQPGLSSEQSWGRLHPQSQYVQPFPRALRQDPSMVWLRAAVTFTG